MEDLKILLVCGSGASSGFMATNIKKEAKKQNINCSVIARSQSEVDSYIDEINVIMVGPHLKYVLEDIKEKVKDRNIKVAIMKKSYYSLLDGELALKHIMSMFD